MSAERDIVNHWLNFRGFYVINNIRVDGTRDIDMLALKLSGRVMTHAVHLEIYCSVTGSCKDSEGAQLERVVQAKFFDKKIEARVNDELGAFSIAGAALSRVLVVGSLPSSKKGRIIGSFSKKGIDIVQMEDILMSVVSTIDTHYHKDPALRTIQLIKHLLLSNPSKLAYIISNKEGTLNYKSRQRLFDELLALEFVKKGISNKDESELVSVLKSSKVRDPEKLAELLERDILNSRTKKPFMARLLNENKAKGAKQEGEKLLPSFFG